MEKKELVEVIREKFNGNSDYCIEVLKKDYVSGKHLYLITEME